MLRAVLLAVMATFLAAGAASAQSSLLQSGPNTPGHVPQYVGQGISQPVVQDGGGSGGGGLGANPGEIGITARSPTNTYPSASSGHGPKGEHACLFDAPTNNPTGYHYLCFDPNAQGGGLFDYGAAGTAAQLPLTFSLNGVAFPFPAPAGGILGPLSTTVGDFATWSNTAGTLVADSPAGAGVLAALSHAPNTASGVAALNGSDNLALPADLAVTGNAGVNGVATIGTGTFAPISYTNTPDLTGASIFAPIANDTTNIPALAVTRTTQGGNPSNQSNETLFVGTHLNLQSPAGFYWGISNQVQVDHNAAPGGNGAYAEAMRSDCEIGAAIEQVLTCWGAAFRSASNSTTAGTYNIGVESEVDKNVADAVPPQYFSNVYFNASFLASFGAYAPGNKINDAAFMVNNFAPAGFGPAGFQVGFECPHSGFGEESIKWSCIYAGNKAPYAIDIGDGTWSSLQIRGVGWQVDPNGGHSIYGVTPIGLDLRYGTFATWQIVGTGWSVDPTGEIAGQSFLALAAPATAYAGEIAYGGTTVAPGAFTCPSGVIGGQTVVGCEVHNVAGRVSYVPDF